MYVKLRKPFYEMNKKKRKKTKGRKKKPDQKQTINYDNKADVCR